MKCFIERAACAALVTLLAGCATLPDAGPRIGSLRFIGTQQVPLKTPFQGTPFGGISGIDYHAPSNSWLLVSDDRSALAPARVYRASLRFGADSFDAVTLTGVTCLRQRDGSTYPGVAAQAQAGGEVVDLEALRVDPRDGSLWYASEGDRRIGLDPFVRQAAGDGTLRAELPLPASLKGTAGEQGPRNNLSFEGLSFAPDGDSLWVSLEAPLLQDGPVPTPQQGAPTRITHLDRNGRVLGQYAYAVDAIPAAPGAGLAADNGISEILATGPATLLVLERSAVQYGARDWRNHVRLYEADMRQASDVQALPALAGANFRPAAKRLLLDFATVRLPKLDNLEGMAFGPRLPNGHATLVFVSDDNFSASQVTQLLLFEVLP